MLNHTQIMPVDRVFSALADASRRAIVDRLARGPASVSELARPMGISLAAVVQHVQVLEASGIVSSAKQGRVRTCRFEPVAVRLAEQWLIDRRVMWEERFDRLSAYMDEHHVETEAPDNDVHNQQ